MADINKQIVRLCSHCQKEQGLEKSMMDATKQGVGFTHGICIRHFEEMLRNSGFDDTTIKQMVVKTKTSNPPPDLAEHPDLIKLYKQGIWLPQQLQQSQPLKESTDLKFRFRKLAGIK